MNIIPLLILAIIWSFLVFIVLSVSPKLEFEKNTKISRIDLEFAYIFLFLVFLIVFGFTAEGDGPFADYSRLLSPGLLLGIFIQFLRYIFGSKCKKLI